MYLYYKVWDGFTSLQMGYNKNYNIKLNMSLSFLSHMKCKLENCLLSMEGHFLMSVTFFSNLSQKKQAAKIQWVRTVSLSALTSQQGKNK